ncbi:hypothetical protein [Paragemmobacter straminiformis]|uniref:Uncharacterized protein n=1 Tax=Paragemmobacter straminiformis TaxID=2045119 RepID=A0A842IBX3_9RHOB|nr:hypothetical protein [Gemmobacter straminiformis]MBC2837076.1 hypothetical protein [Gemmobacter straminiformis]
MTNSRPINLFDSPLDALVLMVFGLGFWTIATLIRTAFNNRAKIVELSRYNPWFVLFNKRNMTHAEAESHLPPFFWRIYGAFGRVGQIIGGVLGAMGAVGLVASLFKKFM